MKSELQRYWKHYVFQSLLAMCSVFLVCLFLRLQNAVIIASIGATAFIIFAMPTDITARPRNVIGGHIVGLLSGSLFSIIPHSTFLSSSFIYSLAVGVSIFIMVVIDTEHPPASGTALGVAIAGFSCQVGSAVLFSAIILSLVHHVLNRHLKDLT